MTDNDSDPTIELESADPQDLADLVSGLTAIGGYAASAGLDNDADRIALLRKRLVIENRTLAEELVSGTLTVTTTAADPEAFRDGIRDILDEHA